MNGVCSSNNEKSENGKQSNYKQTIVEIKSKLKNEIPDLDARLKEETLRLQREVGIIQEEMLKYKNNDAKQQQQKYPHPIVEIDYNDICNGNISQETKDRIYTRGVIIVRNVFSREKVAKWNEELMRYVDENDYFEKKNEKEKSGQVDNYFGTLSSAKPQIFGLYWSKPQMEARTSIELAQVRKWLNNLWDTEHHYNPSMKNANNSKDQKILEEGKKEEECLDKNQECLYADRIRQREPGDTSLGLSPHIDGGSIERWIDPIFRTKVYYNVFYGSLQNYDPFSTYGRTQTREIPSPAVCRMFRTYQGWTALTQQGPGDGTLKVIPITRAIAWVLLRALLYDDDKNNSNNSNDCSNDDGDDDDLLCGAQPHRALGIYFDKYHKILKDAYIPIPTVYPGDTVWWHPDIIHGVEDKHNGTNYSNVMYIGAAPNCPKNQEFLNELRPAFENGFSSPDFLSEDYEVDFTNRFQYEDLNDIGKQQLGYM